MTQIIPRICGGLGNQLFCYAAARRLAVTNNAELVIDDVSGFVRDYAYRRHYQLDHFSIPCRKATASERLEPFSLVRRYLKRAMNRRRPFGARKYIQQEGMDFDPRLLQVELSGTLYLEGYWQSEDYFKDVAQTIRADLQIIPPTDAINAGMAARMRDCLGVAVHVRFFDDPKVAGLNNAPDDYYARAVARIETLAPGAHYFVFSDQPQAACARLKLPDERITCISHNPGDANAYADLWLMTQCRHFIIANSTFSWWGAWLANGSGKRVIAPGFQITNPQLITSWNFAGQLPSQWDRM